MTHSMTGYGNGKTVDGSLSIITEIKSVNSRFFECNIRLPRQLMMFEDKIKKSLQQKFSRGRFDVFVNVQGLGMVKRELVADWDLLEQFTSLIGQFKEKYNIVTDAALTNLLQLENIITIEETEQQNVELEGMLLEAVQIAADGVQKMRQIEGQFLQSDLLWQLELLSKRVKMIESHAPVVIQQYHSRLQQKLAEAVGDLYDQERLLTEVTLFVDKADIHEEITRLSSHIAQFHQTFSQPMTIGRKLDFLLQEMNRETNTIGSKANDAQIASDVVEMKAILEKMKEQVQNVE